MSEIDDYIDGAIENLELKNDSALAKYLGLNRTSVSHWRTRRAWPTDETMVNLAKAAKLDESTALLNLAVWRSLGKNEKQAAKAWKSIAQRIAPAIVLGAIILLPEKGTTAEQTATNSFKSIHYATFIPAGYAPERTLGPSAVDTPAHAPSLLASHVLRM